MIELQEQREILQQNNPEQQELIQNDNIEQTTISLIFKELEEIKQFQINRYLEINENKDLCLFYFNLTQDQNCQNELQEYINPNIINKWQHGFIGKVNDIQIIAYFQNIIQNNDNNSEVLNYGELSKIKLFMKSFFQQHKFKRLNFIVQFNNEENQEILQRKIKHRIYQLFEGFFEVQEEDQDIVIFCLLNKKQNDYDHQNGNQEINLNIKKGYLYSLNQQDFQSQLIQIDSSQINIEYFNQISNNKINVIQKEQYFNQIGFSCIQYIQGKVNIVFRELSQSLYLLRKEIKNLLELQINLNGEANQNQNMQKYLTDLKQLIGRIKEYIYFEKENLNFQQLCHNINDIVSQYSEIIEQDLNNMIDIPNISWKIKKYLSEQQNKNLNFNVDFTINYMNLLEYFKEYYTFDYIKEIFKLFEKSFIFWFNHFEFFIPQRLSYISNFIVNQNNQNNQDGLNVVVLGITRVGKSTLLNIIHDPNNMKLIQPSPKKYCFDVIKKDKMFEISHDNNSKTSSINELLINTGQSDLIFIDTPGFKDTCEERRLINQIKMFYRINTSKQFVTLFLIDGEELIKNKTDLLESIKHTYSFFDEQLNIQQLEQILIPVFTKVNKDIMDEIKNNWESSTMQNCNNQKEKDFLRVIKNKIDKNQYIILFKAENYFISDLEELKNEKQTIYKKKINEGNQISHNEIFEIVNKIKRIDDQIEELKKNKNKIQYQIINSKINNIRDQIFSQCKVLFDQQREQQVEFNFKLSLTASMKNSLDIILKHLSQINNYIDELISSAIINNILYKQRSLQQIDNLLQCILVRLNRFDQQEINSEKLWLEFCEYLDLPKDSECLDELLSQIQMFLQLNSLGQQIQIEQLKFLKLKQHINLLQTIVTELNATIDQKIKNNNIKVLISGFFQFFRSPLYFFMESYISVINEGQQESEYIYSRYHQAILQLIGEIYYDKLNFIPI